MQYYAMQLIQSKQLVGTSEGKIYLFTDLNKCKSHCDMCYLLSNCQPLEIEIELPNKYLIID